LRRIEGECVQVDLSGDTTTAVNKTTADPTTIKSLRLLGPDIAPAVSISIRSLTLSKIIQT